MTTHLGDLVPAADVALASVLNRGGAPGGILSPDDADTLRRARDVLAQLERDAGATSSGDTAGSTPGLLFDISDLLGYYPYNRLPTGVQRVQVNTILAILDAPGDWTVGLCCFSETRRDWLSVPVNMFRDVCAMSVSGGDATAPDWLAQVARLDAAILAGPRFVFPADAYLVNLGTSWWVSNYFVYIREAKRVSNIRFIPLVYDMIPVLFPDYCTPELTNEFVDWLTGIVLYADGFLAISDATRADLIALAAQLGRTIVTDQVAVIPLAADTPSRQQSGGEALRRRGLARGAFVVFVSTIEPRKNQAGAFDAWQKLIATHGREKVPTLVCVGKRGYRSDEILARLDMSPELRDRVLILERVDDDELATLYDNALFTIYPSFYEGWGLPVTESLGHGKVPLIANNSSLPQAGGDLAMQFETGSLGSFLAGLESLIFDAPGRERREQAIRAGYRPRDWRSVSADIVARLASVTATATSRTQAAATLAAPGFYPMTRSRASGVERLLMSAEAFRAGDGWWRLEDFGAWTKAGGGRLRLRLGGGPARIGLCLAGMPGIAAPYRISVNDGAIMRDGVVQSDARTWIFLDVPPELTAGEIMIDLASPITRVIGPQPGADGDREISIGLSGIFVSDLTRPRHHLDFIEAAALGTLGDYQWPVAAMAARPD